MFRNRVLKVLHKARLIEFDQNEDRVRISPLGVTQVEKHILKTRPS
jgi:hypothetical protein